MESGWPGRTSGHHVDTSLLILTYILGDKAGPYDGDETGETTASSKRDGACRLLPKAEAAFDPEV